MNTETLGKIKNYYKYFSTSAIIDIVILGLAAISASFLSYMYYFDINALALVDAGTLTKHVLVISLHYAGALAVVSVSLVIFQHFMTSRDVISASSSIVSYELNLSSVIPSSIRLALWSVFEKRVLRTTLTVILFSLVYIGVSNSLIWALLTSIVFIIISVLYLRFLSEGNGCEDTNVVTFLNGKITFEVPVLTITDEMRETSGNYIIAKTGVIILYLALSIGVGRANYIEENTKVLFSSSQKSMAIVASSSSGLILYDTDLEIILFKPWSEIKGMTLPFKNQKSLKKLVQKSNESVEDTP